MRFDPSNVISFDSKTTIIYLSLKLVMTLKNYITTLVEDLGYINQAFSLSHKQFKKKHNLEIASHDETHIHYQHKL